MTPDEMKAWIDKSSYETLLHKWRFAPMEDPFFQGEIGTYFSEVMKRKRSETPHDEQVSASKRIGWETT